jgi:regulator of cell morphogenesis and NO signaling
MKKQEDFTGKTVGEIVAEDYRTARVFEQHGIDFCCGGNVTISVICRKMNIDPDVIRREIESISNTSQEQKLDYASWELSSLADYIVENHHVYIKENMVQIATYCDKIAEVHGTNHPEVIEIDKIFTAIVPSLAKHLEYEELHFFPAVKRLEVDAKSAAVSEKATPETLQEGLVRLYREHEEVGDEIHRIRHLAHDFFIPDDACNTFVLTYRKLQEFEDDLHKHVHLENNILFPNAAKLLPKA